METGLLNELLSSMSGRMAAVYKHDETKKSQLSLLKNLIFCCDQLGFKINGNIILFYDKSGTNAEHFEVDTLHLAEIDFKPNRKPDRYGAYSVKFSIGDTYYLLKFCI